MVALSDSDRQHIEWRRRQKLFEETNRKIENDHYEW
jgi:hypothetical protein